jgi:hypothetical protein
MGIITEALGGRDQVRRPERRAMKWNFVDGCGSSTVCGSFADEPAIGKAPGELVEITGETILKILGSFPEENRHCAFLAAARFKTPLMTM